MSKSASGAARAAVIVLLAARAPSATVCPSEVARALALEAGLGTDWRDFMTVVHEAVDEMVSQKAVQLSWKGCFLARRSGPYRIGRSGMAVIRSADDKT